MKDVLLAKVTLRERGHRERETDRHTEKARDRQTDTEKERDWLIVLLLYPGPDSIQSSDIVTFIVEKNSS